MVSAFREKVAVLFLLNAVLVPSVMLNRDVIISGTFMLLFVFIQAIIMFSFLAADEPKNYEWHAFWLTVIGSAYMLIALVAGRSLGLEILGFFLFIAYLVSAVVFLISTASKKKASTANETDSGLSDEELNSFRERDELNELLETVEMPEVPKQKHLTEFEDFRKERKSQTELKWEESAQVQLFEDENQGYYEIKAEPAYDEEYSNEGYIELYPEERKTSAKAKPETKKQIQITELKEAPKLDVEKLKQSMQEIGKGVKTLDDRVKLIAEKAILEGAEKKLKKMIDDEKKKKTKKDETSWVYSSVTGNKYHYKRSCMSLKRVRKKDLLLFENSAEARKKSLKACGLCKK